jgi:hypothetical protein
VTLSRGKIAGVEGLGTQRAPKWKQADGGLTVKVPKGIPEYGVAVKAYPG